MNKFNKKKIFLIRNSTIMKNINSKAEKNRTIFSFTLLSTHQGHHVQLGVSECRVPILILLLFHICDCVDA